MNPAAPRPTTRRTLRSSAPEVARTAPGSQWRDDLVAQLRRGAAGLLHPREWGRRGTAFAVLAVLYIALSLLILIPGTPVLWLDGYLKDLHLWHNYPNWHTPVFALVGFGQRWIMTYVLQVIILWAALRARSIRPIVQFATAIILLNTSVGVVKYALGRIGPMHQDDVHDVFVLGGNIFPSGHVSNTIVLYGVLAWALPKYRRALTAMTVFLGVGVGLGTVYLRTHWFSDVVGGWIAGSMVLLAMPTVMPWSMRFADQVVVWLRGMLAQRPRLQRRARAVLAFARRVVPADPKFWGRYPRPADDVRPARVPDPAAPVTAEDRTSGSDRAAAASPAPVRRFPSSTRPAPASEFDGWPAADPAKTHEALSG